MYVCSFVLMIFNKGGLLSIEVNLP